MNNGHDLEQAIMSAWNTKDDIKILCENVIDGEVDKDNISNTLIGIERLHDLRMNKLWSIFEDMIENRKINLSEY